MKLLVVAGEPSGDRAIAAVVDALSRTHALELVGIGGDALAERGARLVGHVRDVSGMGLFELARRASSITRALLSLAGEARASRFDVAVLASWSVANARIGRALRRRGVRVVWISPPEVWAWGASRVRRLVGCADRFAVTLPFEEALWRQGGGDATYVGHPALTASTNDRASARASLGLSPDARALAILPGSRPAEIARLLVPFVDAARAFTRRHPSIAVRLIAAPSLPHDARRSLREAAIAASIPLVEAREGAASLLSAFDVALVASGTASLECALAETPPVIAYRLHPVTMAIARRLVRTKHIALPNVILERAEKTGPFRERVQGAANGEELARALMATLDDASLGDACRSVRACMESPLVDRTQTFATRVASIIVG